MRKQVKAAPTGENNLGKGVESCTCLEKQKKSMSIIGAYTVMEAVVVDEAMIVLARA